MYTSILIYSIHFTSKNWKKIVCSRVNIEHLSHQLDNQTKIPIRKSKKPNPSFYTSPFGYFIRIEKGIHKCTYIGMDFTWYDVCMNIFHIWKMKKKLCRIDLTLFRSFVSRSLIYDTTSSLYSNMKKNYSFMTFFCTNTNLIHFVVATTLRTVFCFIETRETNVNRTVLCATIRIFVYEYAKMIMFKLEKCSGCHQVLQSYANM